MTSPGDQCRYARAIRHSRRRACLRCQCWRHHPGRLPATRSRLDGGTISGGTVNAVATGSLVQVESNAAATLESLTFTGNLAIDSGATLTLDNDTVTAGITENGNGLVQVASGDTLTFENGTFTGGALTVESGATLTAENVTLTGGALHADARQFRNDRCRQRQHWHRKCRCNECIFRGYDPDRRRRNADALQYHHLRRHDQWRRRNGSVPGDHGTFRGGTEQFCARGER